MPIYNQCECCGIEDYTVKERFKEKLFKHGYFFCDECFSNFCDPDCMDLNEWIDWYLQPQTFGRGIEL
jgi:hypothetical protein